MTEFGEKIKVTKSFFPKIKIVSMLSFFKTTNKTDVISSLIEANKILQEIYSKNHYCLKFLFSYDVHGHQSIILKCSPEIRKAFRDNGDAIKIGNTCLLYTSPSPRD